MQRKATKNTRGPNAQEKRYHGWLKEQPCAYCGAEGPSIVDHARGSTFKHLRVLIGHAFCTSKCEKCDTYKTIGGRSLHFEETQKAESSVWVRQVSEWSETFPDEVIESIEDFQRHELARHGIYETSPETTIH